MKTQLIALVPVLALLAGSATAATIHVPAEQPTIQAGIDAAQAGDTILVACGSYFEHEIGLKSGVTLLSESGEPDCVTIDAQQQGRVLIGNLVSSATVVEGFTITGGQTDLTGAGLNCYAGSPVLRRCRIAYNHGGNGGGVAYADGSSPQFMQCDFIGNIAGGTGGAVHGYSPGDHPEFTDCLFLGNFAQGAGSAISLAPLSGWNAATLAGCTLRENHSGSAGAVIALDSANLTLERCIIAFNDGPSVRVWSGSTAELTCCDLFGNEGGDWVDALGDQLGVNGNFSADPLFCSADDNGLQGVSPCAPGNHPADADCGLIGALPVNCEPTAAAATSWSRVKSLY